MSDTPAEVENTEEETIAVSEQPTADLGGGGGGGDQGDQPPAPPVADAAAANSSSSPPPAAGASLAVGGAVPQEEPSEATDGMLSDGSTTMPQEYYCGSCCCTMDTVYMPNSLATFLGSFQRGLSLCVMAETASCVLSSHPKFDELVQGNKEGVCCILSTGETTLVKPLWLTGTKPCFKTSSNGCCCARRCAVPCYGPKKDLDIESTYGFAGAQLCECCPAVKPDFQCCKPVAQLRPSVADAAFEPSPVRISDLFLICHFCCVQQSAYVPETPMDAFGCTDDSMFFCVSSNIRGFELPADAGGYELCLFSSGQCKLHAPEFRCKGTTRIFFNFAKFAFPPDDEVPCAVVCCGRKFMGPPSIEEGEDFAFAKMPPPSNQTIDRKDD